MCCADMQLASSYDYGASISDFYVCHYCGHTHYHIEACVTKGRYACYLTPRSVQLWTTETSKQVDQWIIDGKPTA